MLNFYHFLSIFKGAYYYLQIIHIKSKPFLRFDEFKDF